MSKMQRIIIHWTGGAYLPNSTDRLKYHRLYGKDGKKYLGKYRPEDNLNCKDGKYAAHVDLANTGSIGHSFCAMLGFKNSKNVGQYPITKQQLEGGLKGIAEDCKLYKIPVSPLVVATHYEWGLAHPNTDNKGKIDIIYLPPYPDIKTNEIGDFIRDKVKWYLSKI